MIVLHIVLLIYNKVIDTIITDSNQAFIVKFYSELLTFKHIIRIERKRKIEVVGFLKLYKMCF